MALAEASSSPTFAVLLGTYDGARHLDEQLASIEAQTVHRIDVWVSDDGSSDATLEKLATWRPGWSKGRFEVVSGPREGFSENYRSLIRNRDISADYFAFADQDDIWEPGKLAAALAWMQQTPADRARMFCSRTALITEQGEAAGLSPLFLRPPSFRNALVQSIAGGNTMVLDRRARDLLAAACDRTGFLSHDWWTYLVLSGAGAAIHYSADPLVKYRQHDGNAFGENISLAARADRLRRLFNGQFSTWAEQNTKSLSFIGEFLTPDAKEASEHFARARSGGALRRVVALLRSGAHRQTPAGTIALFVAAAFGRF